MKKTLFVIFTSSAALILAVTFLTNSYSVDGICETKNEYGIFHYYRKGINFGPSEMCSTGIMLPGFINTIFFTAFIALGILYLWKKLIKNKTNLELYRLIFFLIFTASIFILLLLYTPNEILWLYPKSYSTFSCMYHAEYGLFRYYLVESIYHPVGDCDLGFVPINIAKTILSTALIISLVWYSWLKLIARKFE